MSYYRYRKAIQKALSYLDKNLEKPIKLQEVCKVAGISRFHFHRIFVAHVGNSVSDYVRKNRIRKALKSLRITDKRVLDIAIESGYGTHASFHKRFVKEIGCTPSAYRKMSLAEQLSTLQELGIENPKVLSANIIESLSMDHGIDLTHWKNSYFNDAEKSEIELIGYDKNASITENTHDRWEKLFSEVQENIDVDPTGAIGQSLFIKWSEAAYDLFGDNTKLLNKVLDAFKTGNVPQMTWSFHNPQVIEFITQAGSYFHEKTEGRFLNTLKGYHHDTEDDPSGHGSSGTSIRVTSSCYTNLN